ncbi:MAG TPA: GIY-YIG nuclease family protein [Chthoniobacterales bacterium]|jgi:putative endonuclease
MKSYFVYMMTNRTKVVLYTGVTNNLTRCVWEHQMGKLRALRRRTNFTFSSTNETFHDIRDACPRNRDLRPGAAQENELVERKNPKWADLSKSLFEQ